MIYTKVNNAKSQVGNLGFIRSALSYTIWEDSSSNGKLNLFGYGREEIIVSVGDKESNEIPTQLQLTQNYPNPFNPTTTIEYAIPNIAVDFNQSVILTVYDILGRKIKTLVNKKQNPGTYQIVFNASNLASSIYYYSIRINDNILTKKMLLLK